MFVLKYMYSLHVHCLFEKSLTWILTHQEKFYDIHCIITFKYYIIYFIFLILKCCICKSFAEPHTILLHNKNQMSWPYDKWVTWYIYIPGSYFQCKMWNFTKFIPHIPSSLQTWSKNGPKYCSCTVMDFLFDLTFSNFE